MTARPASPTPQEDDAREWDKAERRRWFSTQWHDILPDYLWLNDELIKDRRAA